MDNFDVRALARAANQAFNDRAFDTFDRYIAADVEVVGPDESYRGLDRFIASMDGLAAAFPDMHFEFEDLIVDGNLAAYTTHFRATHNGVLKLPDGRTLPPTGKAVSVLMVSFREIRDGKVVRMVNGWDRLSLLAQLGLLS